METNAQWNSASKSLEKRKQIKFTEGMNRALTDEQLMLKYAHGDISAFETLYEKHKGGVYRFCLRHFNSRSKAEDCFQEIWIKLVNHRHQYEPKALFTTYLYRIAQNQVIDCWRKNKKHLNDCEFDESFGDGIETDKSDPNGDDEFKRGEHLRQAIAELPVDQRSALLLKIDSGFTLEEIGLILGCGRETVKSKLRYATARLKKMLGGEK